MGQIDTRITFKLFITHEALQPEQQNWATRVDTRAYLIER